MATIESEFRILQDALGPLAMEDNDYVQYHAKQLAGYIFEVVTAALLLKESQWQLDTEHDGREALVAPRFVDT